MAKNLKKDRRPLSLSTRGDFYRIRAGKHADDPTLQAAIRTHESFVKTYDSVVKMKENPDPLLPEAANRLKVSKAAKDAAARLSKNSDAVLNDIENRKAVIALEIHERIGIKETPHGQEIRSILRGLSAVERGKRISQAIENGDSELLSAVVLGHPMTLGMTQNDVEKYHERAERAFASDLVKLRETLDEISGLLVDSLVETVDVAEKLEGTPQERKELRQKREAADLAEKSLNDAFSV